MAHRQLMGRVQAVTLVLVVAAFGSSRAEELNLVIQPVYSPARAEQIYKPLTDYLNRATPHKINLVTPRNFHTYWADLRRRDDWDLVFDDAHLTDYKIRKYNYTPLVRTAEPTSFSLIIGYNVTEETLDGLVARRIVTMPAPSLGFVILTQWYQNPLQQPIIVSSALSWADTVEIVFADEADAAIVPTWLAQRYPNLLAIKQSQDFPGAAVSASPNVSEQARADITEALLKLHEDEGLYDVLVELNISQFEPATAAEYEGYMEMLSELFGY